MVFCPCLFLEHTDDCAVVPIKYCQTAKDFSKEKSVPTDTDFVGGEGWIREIAKGCTSAKAQASAPKGGSTRKACWLFF